MCNIYIFIHTFTKKNCSSRNINDINDNGNDSYNDNRKQW